VGNVLDALSLNTVQRQSVIKMLLKLSVPSKDEIFPDGLSNCQFITTSVLRRIKMSKYESLSALYSDRTLPNSSECIGAIPPHPTTPKSISKFIACVRLQT